MICVKHGKICVKHGKEIIIRANDCSVKETKFDHYLVPVILYVGTEDISDDNQPVPIVYSVGDLRSDTLYNFRIKAVNGNEDRDTERETVTKINTTSKVLLTAATLTATIESTAQPSKPTEETADAIKR